MRLIRMWVYKIDGGYICTLPGIFACFRYIIYLMQFVWSLVLSNVYRMHQYPNTSCTPGHSVPICTRTKNLKKLHVTYFVSGFTLKIAQFLFRCTTKPPRIEDTTFFFKLFFITIVKRALHYTLFGQKIRKITRFIFFQD